MAENKIFYSRRDLLKFGAFGAAGLLAVAAASPAKALAGEEVGRSTAFPIVKASITDSSTGELLAETNSVDAASIASCPGVEPYVQINNVSRDLRDNSAGYTAVIRYVFPVTDSMIENAIKLGYVEETRELGPDVEMNAKITLGVDWGTDAGTVQIQRGTFEVSQKSPFITYNNTFYAMMQKDRFIQEMFNGQRVTIESGFPAISFDHSADLYTCGGGVGGAGFNILTGQGFNYQVDLYLE